jgi:hypothetical protein
MAEIIVGGMVLGTGSKPPLVGSGDISSPKMGPARLPEIASA